MYLKPWTIYFFVFLLIKLTTSKFKCVHEPLVYRNVVARYGIDAGPREYDRPVKRDTSGKNMKFEITYEDTKETDKKKSEYVVKNLMPEAVAYFEKLLTVRNPRRIFMPRRCLDDAQVVNSTGAYCETGCEAISTCHDIRIPEKHLPPCFMKINGTWMLDKDQPGGKPLDVDYLFYVSVKETEKCYNSSSTIAYASPCKWQKDTERPLAGYFIMCPKHVKTEQRKRHDVITTIKHEMMHALGFTHPYDGMRYRNGTLITGHIQNHTFTDWWTRTGVINHTVTYLTTPTVTVTEAARRHFNCSKLIGAELENQGGSGTMLTHWEKRIFHNEAMTGVGSYSSIFSNITLAFFYDTGWYNVSFDMAENLSWGYNFGCDFVLKSCGEWMIKRREEGKSIAPYCNSVRDTLTKAQCTGDGTFVSKCNVAKFENKLPVDYQYFEKIEDIDMTWEQSNVPVYSVDQNDIEYYGGKSETSDYCPIPTGFDWTGADGVSHRDSKCLPDQNEGPPQDNAALETTGVNSRCFEHGGNKLWKMKQCAHKKTVASLGAGCYPVICKNGSLWFSLLNGTVEKRCLKTGHIIAIRRIYYRWLHIGSIVCPPCERYCQKENCTYNFTDNPGKDQSDLSERIPCRSSALVKLNLAIFSLFLLQPLY